METTLRGPRWLGPLDMIRSMTNPRPLLHDMVRAHGDPFVVKTWMGPTVFTGHPDGARAVFTADPDTFDVVGRERMGPFFGERSLLLTAGARHRADRKLLTPPFHGARMRAYGEAMRAIAERAMAGWQPGRPFSMLEAAQAIALEVILRAVFGVEGEEREALYRAAVGELTEAMTSPLIVLSEAFRHDFGGIGPWARLRRARARLDALLSEEISARRARAEPREDILSLMMSARYDDGAVMTDDELRDQLHFLLFAGHETTASALAWAFHWLHRQPEVLERLLGELAALGGDPEPDAIAAQPYLDAVCHETLRIQPIVAEVGRLLRKPLTVLGHELAPGMVVMVSVLLIHDREDLYPEPRRFHPERFLSRRPSPFELVAFGGGARRCIGAAFSLYEMKMVLATLLRARRFRLASKRPIAAARRGVVWVPKGGVRTILEGPR